jgi:microcystin-dependent protein
MEFYVGQIIMFGGNFAIRGFALCNGQLIPISQNSALFSILGTTYGGDGQTTFALPDLRGRVPIHTGGPHGQGPGLSRYNLGQRGGAEDKTLTQAEMPSHTHSANAKNSKLVVQNSTAGEDTPNGSSFLANPRSTGGVTTISYTQDTSASVAINGPTQPEITVGGAGGSLPFDQRQPYLAINFEISLYGLYPSRS